ncbi:helix-turn-helix transcriptional regulator [uncultured Roseobacter sp.]|uniref:helix-turn-helix transcriptional regulator n=1 Tax=uncultured Roseobacter sp. TaxID=114847 RepID=UPI0026142900|nr:AraC family transcriptional regulator [uncultured Roseobacter sp.]
MDLPDISLPPTSDSDVPRYALDGDIATSQLDDIAKQLNPRFRSGGSVVEGPGGDVVYKGAVAIFTVADGITLVSSDVTAPNGGDASAVLSRSSTIAMMLEGPTFNARLSRTTGLNMRPFSAGMVNISDMAVLSNALKQDQRAQTILVQCDPDKVTDERMYEAFNMLTRQTEVRPLAVSRESWCAARSIVNPRMDGLIRQLQVESFALGVLASALTEARDETGRSETRISPLNRAALHRARDMIEGEPEVLHTLSSLSRDIGMSPASFKRKFPILFGKSPISYLRDVRLDHARYGIEREGWTVSEAARRVGYGHASNFSLAFRRRFGVSPGALCKN